MSLAPRDLLAPPMRSVQPTSAEPQQRSHEHPPGNRRATEEGRRMEPRRPSPRPPYAAGEDLATPTVSVPPHAPRQRQRRAPASEAERDRYRVGEEALARSSGQRSPRAPRAHPQRRAPRRLAHMARMARVGARAAGRELRRVSPARAIALLAPLVTLIALLLWLTFGSYWQVRRVRIAGTSDATLLALARAQRLTGCDAFRCDFSAAQRAIAASPRVRQVSITVVFPDTALVSITPRATAALWSAHGQTWAIGADGVVIGSVGSDPALARGAAVTVDDPADLAFAGQTPRVASSMNPALVAMASQLRISSSGAGAPPATLRYSAQDGFTALTAGGTLIIFGAPSDAQATLADLTSETPPAATGAQQMTPAAVAQGARLQAQAAQEILARLAQSGATAGVVDVRWGAHPYYR